MEDGAGQVGCRCGLGGRQSAGNLKRDATVKLSNSCVCCLLAVEPGPVDHGMLGIARMLADIRYKEIDSSGASGRWRRRQR